MSLLAEAGKDSGCNEFVCILRKCHTLGRHVPDYKNKRVSHVRRAYV